MAIQPERPAILDYAKPPERPRSGIGQAVGGFLGGWFLGIIVTGILADLITQATRGHHHDGGMYFIAAFAIVLEAPLLAVLRAVLGRRVDGLFAFLFGLLCGPLILVVMVAIG